MTVCVHIWHFSPPVRGASHTPNAEDWFALITAQIRTPDFPVFPEVMWSHTLNAPSACGKPVGGLGWAAGVAASGVGVDTAGTLA